MTKMNVRPPIAWLASFASATVVALAGFVSPASVVAAGKSVATELTVAAERGDAIYRHGESVAFVIRLARDHRLVDDVELSWTLSKDGVAPIISGKAKLTGGLATVTGKMDEPGFLQCRVILTDPDGSSVTKLAAAAIEPSRIRPSMSVPKDFDEFWAAQKLKLSAVPMHVRLAPQESPYKEVAVFDLQADSIGAPVSAYFARPVDAKPRSLPIILTVHTSGIRGAIIGTPDSRNNPFAINGGAANLALQGFLAMDLNAHGIPNGQPNQSYSLARSKLKDYRTQGRESRDTIYFHGMFLRLVRALDFLTSQPEWDERTVVVYGMSQGGYQAIAAAGLDPRVTFFAAAVPAGCDHTGFKIGRTNGWPKFIAVGENPAAHIVEAVRYYDAVNFATRTNAAGILTVGFIDTTCPPTGVYAAYNALGGKKQIFQMIDGGHVNPPPAEMAISRAIIAHVARREAK